MAHASLTKSAKEDGGNPGFDRTGPTEFTFDRCRKATALACDDAAVCDPMSTIAATDGGAHQPLNRSRAGSSVWPSGLLGSPSMLLAVVTETFPPNSWRLCALPFARHSTSDACGHRAWDDPLRSRVGDVSQDSTSHP
jgi:hypothetical protein